MPRTVRRPARTEFVARSQDPPVGAKHPNKSDIHKKVRELGMLRPSNSFSISCLKSLNRLTTPIYEIASRKPGVRNPYSSKYVKYRSISARSSTSAAAGITRPRTAEYGERWK